MMIRPGNTALECWQGATFEYSLTWYNDDAGTQPRNLTGYTAKLQVRPHPSGPIAISMTSAAGGGITLGGAAGTIDLALDATETDVSRTGYLMYDLEMTAPNGDVYRLLEGAFVIYPEVTT